MTFKCDVCGKEHKGNLFSYRTDTSYCDECWDKRKELKPIKTKYKLNGSTSSP